MGEGGGVCTTRPPSFVTRQPTADWLPKSGSKRRLEADGRQWRCELSGKAWSCVYTHAWLLWFLTCHDCALAVTSKRSPHKTLCLSIQFLSPSYRWLNCPVFLPHWNYIPHNSLGSDQDSSRGHVEVIGCPVLLCVSPELGLASDPGKRPELCRAVGLRETVCLLSNRQVTWVLIGRH